MELCARFKGSVQGVGFRYTAKQLADRLHLKGYASNLADGSVEVVAQGSEESLRELVVGLKRSFSGYIENESLSYREIRELYDSFTVI